MDGPIYLDWIEKMSDIIGKKIIWIQSKPATKPGDNYVSDISRVTLAYRESEDIEDREVLTTVIHKSPLSHHDRQVGATLHSYFQSEIMMYGGVFNVYQQFISKSEKLERLWPECFCVSPSNSLVLEDLMASNFQLPRVMGPMPEDHVTLILKGLGRFHGLSAVATEKGLLQPSGDQRFSLFFTDKGLGDNFVLSGMQNVADAIRDTWEPEWLPIREKLLRLKLSVMDLLRDMEKHPVRVKVINHGDIWSKNVMFSYEGDDPHSVKFIDYQNPHFNSYAFDLCLLLYGCISSDLRRRLRSDMMNLYLDCFVETVTLLGLDSSAAPTRDELDRELMRLELFGLVVTCTVLPLDCYDDDMVIGMEDFMDMDPSRNTASSRNKIYCNSKITKLLKENMTYFRSINIL